MTVTDTRPTPVAAPAAPTAARRRWLLVLVATWWTALAAVLFVWTGRFSVAAVEHACGASAPDVRTAPSVEAVQEFLAGCGPAGLAAYRDLQLVDLVYPAVNALLLALVLLLLVRRLPRRVHWVVVLPIAAAAGDYLENAAAWTLLSRGVDGSLWAEQVLRIGSAAKVAATWASWVAVAVLLVWVLVLVVRRRRDDAASHARG